MAVSIFQVFCFFSMFFLSLLDTKISTGSSARWGFILVEEHLAVLWSSYLQSWGLLVVDPCGRAHGGWSSWSRRLLPVHWVAPARAGKTGEQMFRPRQIWNHDHDLRKQMTATEMKILTKNQFIDVYTPGFSGLKQDLHLSSQLCSHFKNMHESFVMPFTMLLAFTLQQLLRLPHSTRPISVKHHLVPTRVTGVLESIPAEASDRKTPWTGHQSITGHTHAHTHAHAHIHEHAFGWEETRKPEAHP